jgi:hypothetical protein
MEIEASSILVLICRRIEEAERTVYGIRRMIYEMMISVAPPLSTSTPVL